ncbi:hypothetical protein PHYBLDRAFT_171332 [Phycomyces blakesleeanus NRRL 1555(-)]|uniref:Retrotransposon gag domain-containing protein n=1 Tax=Phycomyces blakesleeanus (strain ATCC 8743b / DSM 1359 / FGSC 10004 / NBRC 33097 / NRRL 1555) TaxID=763407 RepID=A0A162WRU0_PHYB8|nr:hypothetical protein PHYBLDRAFT_171332 [Phycomyces blakesleeanus NRRL 1555(-)]OAD70585.1 hypothetical protein PHYBLDRAFT_171332 [Phycomyces blakesleeanus NRRL 1555(-)]|eukprot:XP_018288625.1 hypothetical protein PHYBLDRAFT_171332 [Phycomyces blakesleeanus NRRL 1555(-)]
MCQDWIVIDTQSQPSSPDFLCLLSPGPSSPDSRRLSFSEPCSPDSAFSYLDIVLQTLLIGHRSPKTSSSSEPVVLFVVALASFDNWRTPIPLIPSESESSVSSMASGKSKTATPPPTEQSEFSTWHMSENVKSIDVNPLSNSHDLRFWLHEFKQEAAAVDASLDACVKVLRKSFWNLVEAELLQRFASPATVDDRLIITKLRKLRQRADQSIAKYAAEWEHLHTFLTTPFTVEEQVAEFLQSLYLEPLRSTLAHGVLKDISDTVNVAIKVERRARLIDYSPTELRAERTLATGPVPMEIDAVQTTQPRPHLRAYTKDGKPICNLCWTASHRTIDCSKNSGTSSYSKLPYNGNSRGSRNQPSRWQVRNITSTATQEAPQVPEGEMFDNELDGLFSLQSQFLHPTTTSEPSSTGTINQVIVADIDHHQEVSPTAYLRVGDGTLTALVDMGADISTIRANIAQKMNLSVDSSLALSFLTFKKERHLMLGKVFILVFGHTLGFHVVDQVHHEILFGWDNIKILRGIIDSTTNRISLKQSTGEIMSLPLANPQEYQAVLHTKQSTPLALALSLDPAIQDILCKNEAAITSNPKRPMPTHLLEFTIDTADNKPVFIPPCCGRPEVDVALDTEVDEMLANGVLEPCIKADPLKTAAIKTLSALTDYHGIKRFLGIVGAYHTFISHPIIITVSTVDNILKIVKIIISYCRKYESKMVGFVDSFCIKDVRIFSAIRQNIQALAFELRQKSIKSYASFLFYIFYGKIHVCDWMKILIRLLINAQTLYSKK